MINERLVEFQYISFIFYALDDSCILYVVAIQ
jgi:hypothetical protein